jgi:hypothetical protein
MVSTICNFDKLINSAMNLLLELVDLKFVAKLV